MSDSPRSVIASRLRAAGCVFAGRETDLLLSTGVGPPELEGLVNRRETGEPLEQILGWAEFCGLRIAVAPGVFVPRSRSELLAREAVETARRHTSPIVVELCCGSGAIGAALLAADNRVELYAADIDPTAVGCARGNLSARSTVLTGDLYEPLPSDLLGRIDVLVANAPYVPTDEIGTLPREARLYEARFALDGGRDGLEVQRRIATDAPHWLSPDGSLLLETSAAQAAATVELVAAAGLEARVVNDPGLDATVVVGACRSAALLR